MKKVFANMLILLVSLTVSLVLAELAVRGYLYIKDVKRDFDIVISTYQKLPGSKGFRYEFDCDNNFEFKADVRYNNWGYRSDFNWQAKKEPGEYRIAVFGDSYTECVTNDFSWVDILHQNISANKDLLKHINRKKITVANFGREGAGFQELAIQYLIIREKFQPDLTVIAFIDEDFKRLIAPIGGFREFFKKAVIKTHSDGNTIDKRNYLQIPGFDGHLYAIPSGPNIFVRSLFYEGSDDNVILDKENLRNAKRFLAKTVARNKYLKFQDFEFIKLINSIIKNSSWPFSIKSDNNRDRSAEFLKAFNESIELIGPEPLILINLPTFYETVNQYNKAGPVLAPKYFPQAVLQNNLLPIISLADFLPSSASYEQKYSWFTLPWDGHLSNQGAKLFGATLSKLLEDYLKYSIAGKGKPYMLLTPTRAKDLIMTASEAKEREVKEVKAYRILELARKKRSRKHYEESLALFTQVLQLAPYIGMPGLLYVERGDIYQSLGRFQEALDDYSRAIAIHPHKSFLIKHASIAYALGKDEPLKSDIKQLKACCKNDTEVKQLLLKLVTP